MKTTIKSLAIASAFVISLGSNVFAQWNTDPANTTNIYNANAGKVGIGVIPQPDITSGSSPNLSSTLQIRGASGRTGGQGNFLLPVVKVTSPINSNSIGFGLESPYIIGRGIVPSSFINTENRLTIYSTELAIQGNVGIGFIGTTLVPVQKLEVNGNIKTYGSDFLISAGGDRGVGGRALVHGWNNSLYINYNNDFNGGTIFNGNVLIGNKKPSSNYANYSLAVGGLIVSQAIIVTAPSTWADFVFKKSYQLADLKEQEKFIQANGHLEGVPSEAEVMKEGYDVSKMDANLLRKIEELYLYTIALQKTVDAQKNDIESLKKQLKALK